MTLSPASSRGLFAIHRLSGGRSRALSLSSAHIDPEIAEVAGPQLVVPVMNARFALNAANARWGSLYDALYGTDAIDQAGDLAPARDYNPKRGDRLSSPKAAPFWIRLFL